MPWVLRNSLSRTNIAITLNQDHSQSRSISLTHVEPQSVLDVIVGVRQDRERQRRVQRHRAIRATRHGRSARRVPRLERRLLHVVLGRAGRQRHHDLSIGAGHESQSELVLQLDTLRTDLSGMHEIEVWRARIVEPL